MEGALKVRKLTFMEVVFIVVGCGIGLSHKKDGAASFSGRALCGICWKSSDLSGGGAERVQLSDCLRQWKRQYPMAGGVQARVVGWCSLKNEKTHGQTWSPSVIRGCPLCRAA